MAAWFWASGAVLGFVSVAKMVGRIGCLVLVCIGVRIRAIGRKFRIALVKSRWFWC